MHLPASSVDHIGQRRPRSLWLYVLLLFLLSVLLFPVRTLGVDGPSPGSAVDLGALESAFREVVVRVSPSVVGVRARRQYQTALPDGQPAAAHGTVEQLVLINGSGTILHAGGLILTNEHVIHAAAEIEVVLHDGRTLPATVAAADPRSDLAILRIDAEGLAPAKLCVWQRVARGQWSIAVGNPYGLGSDGQLSVSVGVISNLGRQLPGLGEVDDRLYADMIQTTAAIYPGNSGGPLFNISGELIGVVTAVHTRSVDDEGVGFAIPLTPAKRRVIERLLAGRRVRYGYVGLTVRELAAAERAAAGLEPDGGVWVQEVEPGGAAAKAGVLVGDVVTHFDGRPVAGPLQFADLVGQTPVGEQVELKLRRSRSPLAVRITVVAREIGGVSRLRGGAILWRGMRLADLTPESPPHAKLDAGTVGVVVINVVPGSPADRAHIRPGHVIERVEDATVGEVLAFRQAVRGRKDAVQLQIRSRGAVAVPP